MDPLSDVLSILKPESYMFRALDASGAWSLAFPPMEGIRCYCILTGECWFLAEPEDEPIRLLAGDCVLQTKEQAFRLCSDPTLPSLDALAVFSSVGDGETATLNEGGKVTGLGGYFDFSGAHSAVLLSLLPPLLHVQALADRQSLRASIEVLMRELREPQPGSSLMGQHLGQALLILALRLYLQRVDATGVGWLFALADKSMAAALGAIHREPQRRWMLSDLAAEANMSRSSFAQRFKDTVGEAPMEYLTRWRMMLAANRLTQTQDSISTIAYSLGYESDSAFSSAFRRVMGESPRQYAADHSK
jgi:AraC-like DNA-binding protein